MNMVHSSCIEESSKALFAISAVIRNNVDGLTLFYSHSGFSMLQVIHSIIINSKTLIFISKIDYFSVR